MIARPSITRVDGSTTVVDDNESQQDYNEPTTDPVFGGGRTGSETMAEAGDPSAVVTADPHSSSLEEKMREDGAAATVETFKDLASDGDDSNDGPTFDHVQNNDEGRSALEDTAKTFSDVAKKAATPTTTDTAAANAAAAQASQNAAAAPGGPNGPDGILGAILGALASLLAGLFGGN